MSMMNSLENPCNNNISNEKEENSNVVINDNDNDNLVNENNLNENNSHTNSDNKKQISYFELILKYKNKININYNDYDFQKGENSPRLLFRKRKNENSDLLINYSATKISKNIFLKLLDRNNLNINSNHHLNISSNSNNQLSINNMGQVTTENIPSGQNNVSTQNNTNNITNNAKNTLNNNAQSSITTIVTGKISSQNNKDKEKDCLGNNANEMNFNPIPSEERNGSHSVGNNTKIFKILHDNSDHRNANKIRTTFENYLDVVHDSYFTPEEGNFNNNHSNNTNYFNGFNSNINLNNSDIPSPAEEDSSNLNKTSDKKLANNFLNCFNSSNSANPNLFKFSSLDLLINPLRSKFIWETWSPYEIALFECCICKFGKNFDLYPRIVN
jgi:hypothetical protein